VLSSLRSSHWPSKGTVIAEIPPIAAYKSNLGPAQTIGLNTSDNSILKLVVEGKNYDVVSEHYIEIRLEIGESLGIQPVRSK